MKQKKFTIYLILMVMNLAVFSVCCLSSGASELFLLTSQEAAHLRFSATQWRDFQKNMVFGFGPTAEKTAPEGPWIIIQQPEIQKHTTGRTLRCSSPLTLEVIFRINKAPVDMGSLEITARKGVFSKSLTHRLAPFIRENTISAENVAIPPGHYCVEVSIADIQGATTVRTYGLQVN